MTEKTGGREGGEANVKAFKNWGSERERAGDWTDYVYRGQLNRSEVARECNFALSCFRSNPSLKSELISVEARLREAGILPDVSLVGASTSVDCGSHSSTEERILNAKYKAEQRIKTLEEQNASLKAEVLDLRQQLKRFEHLDAHLCRTGRLLQP
jgi:hypothetical protein